MYRLEVLLGILKRDSIKIPLLYGVLLNKLRETVKDFQDHTRRNYRSAGRVCHFVKMYVWIS